MWLNINAPQAQMIVCFTCRPLTIEILLYVNAKASHTGIDGWRARGRSRFWGFAPFNLLLCPPRTLAGCHYLGSWGWSYPPKRTKGFHVLFKKNIPQLYPRTSPTIDKRFHIARFVPYTASPRIKFRTDNSLWFRIYVFRSLPPSIAKTTMSHQWQIHPSSTFHLYQTEGKPSHTPGSTLRSIVRMVLVITSCDCRFFWQSIGVPKRGYQCPSFGTRWAA